MRILYEGTIFRPRSGGAVHIASFSSALADAGHCVTVVVPKTVAWELNGHPHVRVVGLPTLGPRVVRHFTLEFARSVVYLWWSLRGRRFDLEIARLAVLPVGRFAAGILAHRRFVELNGPLPEEVHAVTGSRWGAAFARLSQRQQLSRADAVIAVSPGLADYALKHGGEESRILLLPNASDPIDAPAARSADTTLRLVFAGAFVPWYEMETIFEALSRMWDIPWEARVLGAGQADDCWRRRSTTLGLGKRVRFLGWVSKSEVHRALSEADVGLLPLRPKLGDESVIGSPLKLYEYLAAGLGIVGTSVDGIGNSGVPGVFHYSPGSVDGAEAALRQAYTAKCQEHEESPRCSEEVWAWSSRVADLETFIRTNFGHNDW